MDHVKLVLLPELDPPALGTGDCPEVSDFNSCSVLGSSENRTVAKPEKGFKKMYVPKQSERNMIQVEKGQKFVVQNAQ